MNKPLVYLASPYTHPDAVVREIRFKHALLAAGKLLEEGFTVFSPIVHFHPIAEAYKLPTDWAFWENLCRQYLSVSNRLIVLEIPGWEESTGVTAEMKIAKEELNIPIEFIKH